MKLTEEYLESVAEEAKNITAELMDEFNKSFCKHLQKSDKGATLQLMVYQSVIFYIGTNFSRLSHEAGFPKSFHDKLIDILKNGLSAGLEMPEHFIRRDTYEQTKQ
jgi:hypothetical protein